jgi:hypothetical protein
VARRRPVSHAVVTALAATIGVAAGIVAYTFRHAEKASHHHGGREERAGGGM